MKTKDTGGINHLPNRTHYIRKKGIEKGRKKKTNKNSQGKSFIKFSASIMKGLNLFNLC